MARKVAHEVSERLVRRNGVSYKFNKYSSPIAGYVELTAHRWTGHDWEFLHRIVLYIDGRQESR